MIEEVLTSDDALVDTALVLPRESGPYEVPFEELDPVSARQAVLALLGQKSITATDISALALGAAKLAANTCEVDSYSVAETIPNGEGLLFRFGQLDAEAQPTTAAEYELTRNDQESLSGYTLSVRRPVVVFDVEEETRYVDRLLNRYQIKSAVVCPLMHPNGPLGTMGVYSRVRHDFASADVFFLESVANLIAISFARRSAEKMVAVQSKRLEALIESSDTPTLELTPEGRIKHCNSALERISGFSLAEIEDRTLYSAFLLPEELDEVKAALSTAVRNQECTRRECFLLTKSGARRRMIWSFTCVVDDDAIATSLLGTGVDITEQHEMNDRVKRAEATADNAVQSLRAMRAKVVGDENAGVSRGNRVTVKQDRRRNERRPFPNKQILAPVVGGRLPSLDAFREVRCHDLSSQGFCYQSTDIPDYQQLLVAFGKQGSLIYLTAEIVHVSPTTFNGEDVFLVGCRYTGRTSFADSTE
ncbi:MAG: PAS domain S-box protein [Pirellulaceae bacterium]